MVKCYFFDYCYGLDEFVIECVVSCLYISFKESVYEFFCCFVYRLLDIFYEKEVYLMEIEIVECFGEIKVVGVCFGFDDVVY